MLIEREAELSAVCEVLTRAAHGSGGSVAVVGPAGIGKTSILAAVPELAAAVGSTVLAARGGELERDYSFGVVRQLLEAPMAALDGRARRSVLAGAAAAAAPIVGTALPSIGGARRVGAGKAKGDEFAAVHGLYWACANLADRSPLVLVVDDAHWTDDASARFLAYLQRRLEGLPIALIVASRPLAAGAHAAAVEQLTSRLEASSVLEPLPLSASGIGQLFGDELGQDVDDAIVEACVRATGGNPFLCRVVLAALAERDRPDDPAEIVAHAAGQGASGVVARLGRLGRAAERLTAAVAVLGTQAELRHAAALADLELAQASAAADELIAMGILAPGRPLELVHPLVHEAIRAHMPGARRAALHEAAARLLASEQAPTARVASHLLAAEPATRSWVVDVLCRAGEEALAAGDPGAACDYLRRALREPPSPTRRAELLHALGRAEFAAGDPVAAAAALEESVHLASDVIVRGQISRELAAALATPGRYGDAAAALETALGALGGSEPDLARQIEADLHQCALLQPGLYREVAVRLDGIDRSIAGSTPAERALLAAFATEDLLLLEPAARVRAHATRAFEHGLLEDAGAHSPLWGNAAFPLVCAEGFEEAAAVAERSIALARAAGTPLGAARAHGVRALLGLRRGDLRAAEADARIAVDLGLRSGYLVALIPLGVLVETLAALGKTAEARLALIEANRDGALEERFLECFVLHGRGWLALAEGDTAAALEDFEELGRRGADGWRSWNPGLFAWRSGLALARLRSGQGDAARALAVEELELARRFGAPRAIGVALRSCGLATGGADGLDLLAESVAVLEGSGARLEQARSLVELGAAKRRAGERSASRPPLEEGLDLAWRCGAQPLAEQARVELVAAGARPRRAARSGVDALTASELRVAGLAAEGMTNREIAQALFVTLRTVQVHLTNAYRKLGISSRGGLAAALERDEDE